ncbi:MAG TPA: DUF4440 domain-containing protein [Thermoanaerobaculia bacterium]
MRKRFLAVLLLFLSLPLAAQTPPVVTHGPKSVAEPQIDAIYTAFVRGYEALDPAVVAGFYAEDAVYLPPGDDILRGRPAIQQSFAQFFDSVRREGGGLRISFEIVERKVSGDLAYDVGYYRLERIAGGKAGTPSTGKFVVVAGKEEGGVWRIRVDAFNSMPKK